MRSEKPKFTRLTPHRSIGDTQNGVRLSIIPPIPHTPEYLQNWCNPHQSNINGIGVDNFEGLHVISENKSHFSWIYGCRTPRGPIWGTLQILLVDAWVKRGKKAVKTYFWHSNSPFHEYGRFIGDISKEKYTKNAIIWHRGHVSNPVPQGTEDILACEFLGF